MSNDSFDDNPEVKREIRRIDGVLPEDINRRSFFKKTMASVMGLSTLAGCASRGDGGAGSTAANETTDTSTTEGLERLDPGEVSFRNFWRPKQGYAFEYMSAVEAEGKPNFMDEQMNARPPDVSAGTNDASQYTGTGEADLGLSSWSITVNGLENDWDSVTFGMSNPKAFVGLIYDESVIEDPEEDLAGADVAQTGNLMEVTWPLYGDAIGVPQDDLGSFEYVSENVVGAFLRERRVDAVWTTINDFPTFESVAAENDVSLGVDPLYKREPFYGLNLVANGEFMEENPEYIRRYLTAYSMAGKWSLLHPEEVLDIFRQDIRPSLQTNERESQLNAMKISVFWTNYTDGIRDNGVGYINPDVAETSTQAFADSFGIDASVDDFVDFSVQEDAELDPFTSDEWSQMEENGQPYLDLFG